jgi:hypothetical protein
MLTPEEITLLWNKAEHRDFRTMIERFAALVEAKALEEREALEQRLSEFLRSSCLAEATALFDEANRCFSVRLDRGSTLSPFFGEGHDYWQALRAALDAAEKVT